MAYDPTVWVDENGTGNGTPVTAARMNKIETAIDTLDSSMGSMSSGGLVDGGNFTTNHTGNLKVDFGSFT